MPKVLIIYIWFPNVCFYSDNCVMYHCYSMHTSTEPCSQPTGPLHSPDGSVGKGKGKGSRFI